MNSEYKKIQYEITKQLSSIDNYDEKLRLVVKILKEKIEKYHWVGIYLKEGDQLILHNYIGFPTIHSKIPIEEGICGAAVREGQTIIVDDVLGDPRYIACSLATRSEIVVPIYNSNNEIIGEIDIDSDLKSAFTQEDKSFLEDIAKLLIKD